MPVGTVFSELMPFGMVFFAQLMPIGMGSFPELVPFGVGFGLPFGMGKVNIANMKLFKQQKLSCTKVQRFQRCSETDTTFCAFHA